jgi:hypothetical protein
LFAGISEKVRRRFSPSLRAWRSFDTDLPNRAIEYLGEEKQIYEILIKGRISALLADRKEIMRKRIREKPKHVNHL